MQEINSRLLVLEMLLAVSKEEQGAYSHVVVRDVLDKYSYLSRQEKGFIKRLFEGTLERAIELDYCMDCFSKTPSRKMKPVIRTILRMGVYQILYMDSVPDSAACNEAVKLAQKKGFSTLKGFVNGVLRSVARNKTSITYPDLSVAYSMPEWIVSLWQEQLGREQTKRLLAGLLSEHSVTVRFRRPATMAEDIAAVRCALEKQGGTMEAHPYLTYAYRIYKTDDITLLPGYEEGAFVIQDVSSMLAVEALGLRDVTAPLRVLDVCAAPGGKSMLAADLLEAAGIAEYTVTARDISDSKVCMMEENFKRCRLPRVSAEGWDATQPDLTLAGKADIVIADVPCSGLGVIGKKRDIKYKVTPESMVQVAELQERILRTAVTYLKEGGRLLFSTCTINREENENHFEWIKDELKLTPVSLNDMLPECLHSETTEKGYLQLLPGIHDTDGFFISVFTKAITSRE